MCHNQSRVISVPLMQGHSWPRALRRYQWAPGGVNEAGHATPKSSDSFLRVVIGLASSIE